MEDIIHYVSNESKIEKSYYVNYLNCNKEYTVKQFSEKKHSGESGTTELFFMAIGHLKQVKLMQNRWLVTFAVDL